MVEQPHDMVLEAPWEVHPEKYAPSILWSYRPYHEGEQAPALPDPRTTPFYLQTR